VAAGGTATFTVAASGADLAYQWQRDGKDIAGATASTYTLANVQAGDSGASFTVVVKNGGGSVTSRAAVLTVLPPVARGLSLLAGTLGGPGNLDGADGRLAWPVRIALSPSGLLYVADDVSAMVTLPPDQRGPQGVTVLRTVNVATGDIETVGADPLNTTAMAFDAAGNLYEAAPGVVYRTPPGGKRALFAGSASERGHVDGTGAAARFDGPTALATDAQGNVYVGDATYLRKMSPGGVVTTVAAGFTAISALAIDGDGNVDLLDATGAGYDAVLRVVTPAGIVSTRALKYDIGAVALRAGMPGIAVDKGGNVYVSATEDGCRIRKVDPSGAVTDLAGQPYGRGGSDGKGAAATFCQYDGPYTPAYTDIEKDMSNLVLDTAGNLVIADTTNHTIRRVTPAGDVSTVAGRKRSPWPNVDGPGSSAQFVLNFYETATLNPRFSSRKHYGLAADAAGNVYVAEGDRIRKIGPDGRVGTMPSPSGGLVRAVLNLGGLPFGGNALVTDVYGAPRRINADGSLAALPGVTGWLGENQIVVDALGNVYWLDTPTTNAARTVVRRTAPDGTVTTMPDSAETLGTPDADGDLWNVLGDGTVTRRGPDGQLAVGRTGGATPGAVPLAIARDRAGNLYVAWHETPNWYSVHKITPSGVDSVIAGAPGAYGVRLGAPGSLGAIDALTVGMDDNIYVISENAVLRIVP
jgi:sugar lactone lactonase YvrE